MVVKSNFHDQKSKKKAMKAVSSITGIDSMLADVDEGKLTIIGNIDPVSVAKKLRAKKLPADIVSVSLVEEEHAEEATKEIDNPPPSQPSEGEKSVEKLKEHISIFLQNNYENRNPFAELHSVEEPLNLCLIS